MSDYQNTHFMINGYCKITQSKDINRIMLWRRKVIYLKYDQKLA